jgi:hypothetical protein
MEVQTINYAPPLPLYRRRRFRRVLFAAVFLVVTVTLAPKFLPLAWHHVQLLYWQRQSMNYTAQADQMVYSSDPASEALRDSSEWQRFYQLLSPPGRLPKATLFLHELHNGKGESRLVVVEGDIIGVSSEVSRGEDVGVKGDLAIRMSATVIRPGSAFSDPQELPEASRVFILGQFKQLRAYAGQCDSGDNSRFCIRLAADGQTRVVDGWLRDDDTVVLETRR